MHARFQSKDPKYKLSLSGSSGTPFEFTVCAVHLRATCELAKLELARLPSVLPPDPNLIIAGDWNLKPSEVASELDGYVICHGGATNLPELSEREHVRDFFAVKEPLVDHQRSRLRLIQQQAGETSPVVNASTFCPVVCVLERDKWLRHVAAENPPAHRADGMGRIPIAWLKQGLSDMASSAAGCERTEDDTVTRSQPVNGFARSGWSNHRMAFLTLRAFSSA